jgi:hypothetical protein
MTLHRIQLLAIALILFTLFLTSGVAKPTGNAPPANWTFEGCWTQFSAGTCRDVFRDNQGNHWICRDCGTTGNPGPGKCNQISSSTLASGFWCS